MVTLAELRAHRDQGWVALADGKIYDLTHFARVHPGGEHIIHALAGRDAADLFRAFHPNIPTEAKAHAVLKHMPVVAYLDTDDSDRSPLQRELEQLRAALEQDGTYRTTWTFYLAQVGWLALLFAAVLVLTLRAATLAQAVLAAGVAALFLQQTAFVGHDAGHSAITHRRGLDRLIGLVVGPVLTGLSISWWRDSHNTHHVATNEAENDPDIQHLPVLCVIQRAVQRGCLKSSYHRKNFVLGALARFFVQWQTVLCAPLLMVSRFNLYLQSVAWFFSWRAAKMRKRDAALELALIGAHHLGVALLVAQLPTWRLRLAWYLATNCLASILNVQIVSSHFGMDILHEPGDVGREAQFLRQQLVTTTDIRTTAASAWFFGGLQHQVAHHVFPRVPRHNLPALARRLKALCKQHGVEYREDSFAGILVGVWRALARVADAM
jgi:delta8-fatty-acid desaturase